MERALKTYLIYNLLNQKSSNVKEKEEKRREI